MLRQLTATIFIIAFVTQTFSGQFIVLDYFANTTSYAKNCVNKAKPKLQCNGKCQMMKKMQQEEKKDQQNPERKSENKAQVISSKSFFNSLSIPAMYSCEILSYQVAGKIVDRTLSIFHPPQL